MAEQKKANTCLILGGIGAGITVVLCMGEMLAINANLVWYTTALPIAQTTASSLDLKDVLKQEISAGALDLIARLGWSDSFTILIHSIDGVNLRCETSRCNQFCTRVDFVHGEMARTTKIETASTGTIIPAWHYPHLEAGQVAMMHHSEQSGKTILPGYHPLVRFLAPQALPVSSAYA